MLIDDPMYCIEAYVPALNSMAVNQPLFFKTAVTYLHSRVTEGRTETIQRRTLTLNPSRQQDLPQCEPVRTGKSRRCATTPRYKEVLKLEMWNGRELY